MLWMIQRVFYGPTSSLVSGRATRDVVFREHAAVWPMALLMLVMGVASPYWIQAIDGAVTALVPAATVAQRPCPLNDM